MSVEFRTCGSDVVYDSAEKFNMQDVLTGGSATIEIEYGDAIMAKIQSTPVNLIGKADLKQMLSVIHKAKAILAQDTSHPSRDGLGCARYRPLRHLNLERARLYLSSQYLLNHYSQALCDKYSIDVNEIPWGTRERDGTPWIG